MVHTPGNLVAVYVPLVNSNEKGANRTNFQYIKVCYFLLWHYHRIDSMNHTI